MPAETIKEPTWRCRFFWHRWGKWSTPVWEVLNLPVDHRFPVLGMETRQVYTQERTCQDCGVYRWRRA